MLKRAFTRVLVPLSSPEKLDPLKLPLRPLLLRLTLLRRLPLSPRSLRLLNPPRKSSRKQSRLPRRTEFVFYINYPTHKCISGAETAAQKLIEL